MLNESSAEAGGYRECVLHIKGDRQTLPQAGFDLASGMQQAFALIAFTLDYAGNAMLTTRSLSSTSCLFPLH